MKSTIIKIGNSQGVRLPKSLLEQTKLRNRVDLVIKNGGVYIKPAKEPTSYTTMLSETALAKGWLSNKEDEAWAHLQ